MNCVECCTRRSTQRRCAGADARSGVECQRAAAGESVAGILRSGSAGAALRSAVSRGGRLGPTSPAAQARDREGVARAVQALRQRVKGRVFAGGHSYGGRQTAMIAAERPDLADGLLLLSYPLHPPRKPDQPRTGFFPEWRTPALFVHGTRDPFGTLEELRGAIGADSGARGSAGGGRRGPRPEGGGADGRGDLWPACYSEK